MDGQCTLFFFICFTALSNVFSADDRFARSMNTVPLRATIISREKNKHLLNHPRNGVYFNIFFAVTAQCWGNICGLAISRFHFQAHTRPNINTSISLLSVSTTKSQIPLMITYEDSWSMFYQILCSHDIPFPSNEGRSNSRKRSRRSPLCQRLSSCDP